MMMTQRLILGTMVAFLVVILPVAGNVHILCVPHLWILLAFGIVASLLQPGYNPFTIFSKAGDRGTGAQIIWSVYATQLAAVLEAAYLRYPRSVEWDAVAWFALLVATLGLALRTWAILTLGNLFTMHISVEKHHRIIRKGPYAVIRHPSYLGAFLLYLSMTVFLHTWFSASVAAVILAFAFLRRIDCEEKVLKEQFGAEYESYCLKVKRILPGIW